MFQFIISNIIKDVGATKIGDCWENDLRIGTKWENH